MPELLKLIILLVVEVCDMSRPCRNAATKKSGMCQDICDPLLEYEIFDADTCNGDNCACCGKKGVLSICCIP